MKYALLIALLLLATPVFSAPVLLTASPVQAQAPCTAFEIPVSINSPLPQKVFLQVSKSHSNYAIILPSLIQTPGTATLIGKLPCSFTGVQEIQIQAYSEKKALLAKKNIVIPVAADYTYGIEPLEELKGCIEDKPSKQFVLKNKGNSPNVYILTSNEKQLRITLPPRAEQKFALTHETSDNKETKLTITPLFGKEKTFTLLWELTKCVDLSINLPKEIEVCTDKPVTFQYEASNNGVRKEQIFLDFDGVNESFSLEPGQSINRSVTIDSLEDELIVPIYVNNKLAEKANIQLTTVDACNELYAKNVSVKDGKWIIVVTNKGTNAATYTLSLNSSSDISLETTSLTLKPGESGQIIINNAKGSQEIVLKANEQLLRVYLDSKTPFIKWETLDKYASTIGITVLIPLILAMALYFIVSGKKEDIELKKSWFSKLTYDSIDFDHLFDNEKSYPAIFPKKKFPKYLWLFFLGAILLVIGTLGIFSIYPEEAPWIVLMVGGGVTALAILFAGLWFGGKRIKRWYVKQKLAAKRPLTKIFSLLLIVLAGIFWKKWVPRVKDITLNAIWPWLMNHGKIILYVLGGIVALIIMLSILRKLRRSWQKRKQQKAELKNLGDLSRKIKVVERKTRTLKKELKKGSV